MVVVDLSDIYKDLEQRMNKYEAEIFLDALIEKIAKTMVEKNAYEKNNKI